MRGLFTRLANMSVDESGLGDRAGRPNKRFKIMGILRDALRQKSMGIIEEIPEKGIVKYAKPAGVIASLVPVTNAALTESGNGIYALKCKDAIIFSPHPASKKTTNETVRLNARRAEAGGRTRGHLPMRREAQHSSRRGVDVDLRFDHRDRRTGDGQGCI
jgi:sulfoacetaldehyde dehydrogenase